MELKIQWWVVMEICQSPYRVYLNNLSKTDFIFKFLQTKKYVKLNYEKDEELQHFVGYFIKILQEELRKE